DRVTNNGLMMVASGVEAGGTLQFSVDNRQTWQDATLNESATGYATFNVSEEGSTIVYIRQIDVAGNISTKNNSASINLDTTSPDVLTASLANDTNNGFDSITSDGTINITGLESSASWQYSVDGSVWTAGSGSSVTLQQDNDYTVLVRQIDLAGNMSSNSSLSFMLDTKAPDAPTVSLANDTNNGSDNITSNGTINVAGLESDAAWEYSLNGSTWTDGSGSSFSVKGDAQYSLQVRQMDVAGNVSNTGSLSFTLDTTAPEGPSPILSLDTNIGSDGITSSATININHLESGATWEYNLTGEESGWVSGSGSSLRVDEDGSYTLQVRQTDQAGNVSETESLSFTLDTSAPSAPSLALSLDTNNSSDNITSSATINVAGLESDAVWEYNLTGEESGWVSGSGSSLSVTEEGSYSLQVRQMDVAGNVSNVGSLSFTLDTTIPTSVSLELESGVALSSSTFITNDRTILINNLESGATWEYRGTGASNWTLGSGSSLEISGDDGEKYVQIRQIDLAGNVQSMWDDITFTLDTTAPEGPSPYLASDSNISTDSITNNRLVNIDYLESGATWEYSLDGSTWTDGSGSSVAVEGSGEKTIQVRQTDLAGNVSDIESLSFTLDTSAPSAPSLALALDTNNSSDNNTSSATINVDGLEYDADLEYNLTGEESGWVSGSGSSLSVTEEGSYSLQVRQMDVAGNVSNVGSLSFTLDTTAPANLALSLSHDSGASDSDWVTSSATILISNLESDARWEYKQSDSSEWIAGSGSTLRFEDDSNYNLQVRQIDLAGNVSEEALFSFTLDTTVATPTVSLINDSGTSNSDRITNDGRVSVDGLESDASWQFSVDAGSSWTTGSGSSFTVTTGGNYDLRVRQTDVAGNTSSPASLNFTLDVTAAEGFPALTKDSGSSSVDRITNDGRVTVTGIESDATWEYRVGSDSGAQWVAGESGGFTVDGANNGGSDGAKLVYVRQTDVAGNVSTERNLSFTLDTTAPVAISQGNIYKSDSGTKGDSITNSGSVTVIGIESGAAFEYSLNAGETWATASSVIGSGFLSLSGDGQKNVLIRQIDVAGNISENTSFSFTLDTTATTPQVILSDSGSSSTDRITNNGVISVDGLESGATWQYSTNGGSVWTSGS
ncbi:MAG: Ig-like domain-containing protein, partial [Pseudohongiella sp.]|nr:Ig-like domain-containing protein [Pseudohongiella sp.]